MRTMRSGVLVWLLGIVQAGCAHWGLTAEIGVARFAGTARDTAGQTVRPYRPTTFGLGVDRAFGKARVGLDVRYAKTGYAGEGQGVAVVYYDDLFLIEAAPTLSVGLARFGEGLTLRLEGGPIFDFWQFSGEDFRTRIGGRVGVSVDWPVLRWLRGELRIAEAVVPSVFDAAEFPPEVDRLPTWRTSVALGLRYRL